MEILLYIFIFFFGICVGSFLNVVIYRLPRDISVIKKTRSFCPKCKKQLSWWELIPLFSFLFLRGKCFKCKSRISLRYPVVELLTGLLFIFVFIGSIKIYDLGFMIDEIIFVIYLWIIIGILIAIFFIDLKHYIIPDSLIIIGSAVSLFYLLTCQFCSRLCPSVAFSEGGLTIHDSRFSLFFNKFIPISNLSLSNSHFINHLFFAIIGLAFFGIIILLTRGKGMGMGDMKLAFLMGLILGEKLLIALYLAFIVGALVGVVLIILKKKKLSSMVPFGPFLVTATLALMLL